MNTQPRIYLDNAATSWPKPEVVYTTIDSYQRTIGAAAGRAGYEHAQLAQRTVENTRTACAQFLGIADPRQLSFTSNGTDALNLAIHGLLRSGDHVVTTVCEHNSVLRPLNHQVLNNGVTVTYVNCDSEGFVDPDEIAQAIQPNTRFVSVIHASNVTGAIQPIAEISRLAHERDTQMLVDAAQTAGCLPIDVEQLGIDILATGGHKGLLGPLGTGLLYVQKDLVESVRPLRQGGTGTDSQDETQPQTMPEMLESGNLNVPAIAGLGAAVKFLSDRPSADHHTRLTKLLLDQLAEIRGVRVYGPRADQPRVCVVSFAVEGYDPQEFASALDAVGGVECRAGLHCAPRMHVALGTGESGGLVRVSPGWATTDDEIARAIACVGALVAAPAT
ncbi:MAG: aminotransferase class V-fold PLP-dependent enzyme [Planctomycetes bacterium]|nr:aminotransferase class V-fold PLP-dependent enzyme [Planctomycetota bacterium]